MLEQRRDRGVLPRADVVEARRRGASGRRHHGVDHVVDVDEVARLRAVAVQVDRLTERLGDAYQGALRWSLRHKLATVLLALGTFVASFFVIPLLGAEFVPKADFSETQVNFYTPVGSSLEVTESRARQLFFFSILYLPLLLTVMVLDKMK